MGVFKIILFSELMIFWKNAILNQESELESLKRKLLCFRACLNHLTLMFIDRLSVHLKNACCDLFLYD